MLIEEVNGRSVYAVTLECGSVVYMRYDEPPYPSEEGRVIVVEAEDFLEAWRDDPIGGHSRLATGSPDAWRKDGKYPDAVKGFSHGRENPVPLAEVAAGGVRVTRCEKKLLFGQKWLPVGQHKYITVKPFVTFINGITRTMFLLSNGAKRFPVYCESGSHWLGKLGVRDD